MGNCITYIQVEKTLTPTCRKVMPRKIFILYFNLNKKLQNKLHKNTILKTIYYRSEE